MAYRSKLRARPMMAVAAALLSGCAGSQSVNTVMPTSVAPSSVVRGPAVMPGALRSAHAKIPRDLYVAGEQDSVVYVLRNKTYRDVGVITNGVDVPSDVTLDRQGNLYVANLNGADITEYAPGTNSPSFTYNNGITGAITVATDAHGNVFEGDSTGFINEYFQGFNLITRGCDPGGLVLGLAVDAAGDVFANVAVSATGPWELLEYPGGLGNCADQTVLGATPGPSWGIALDAKGDLLVAALTAVDVIPAPYTSITGTIGSGFSEAINVSLNKADTEAYVADYTNRTVTVVSYPGGANLTVLGAADGLSTPNAAVDWPNAVY